MHFSFRGRGINTISFMICSLITYLKIDHYRAKISTLLGDEWREKKNGFRKNIHSQL